MRNKVFVTRSIPESARKKLVAHCDVEMWDSENTPVPREVLESKIAEIDGLYCWTGKDRLSLR